MADFSPDSVKKAYDEIAEHFDVTRRNPWKEFNLIKPYIDQGKKTRVLDLGCGNGRFLDWLVKNDYTDPSHYTGVDFSEGLINTAQSNHPGYTFVVDDMVRYLAVIPDKDVHDCDPESRKNKNWIATSTRNDKEKYDLISLVASFHHINNDTDRADVLNHISDNLSEDGYVYISVWNLFQKKYSRHIIAAIIRYVSSFSKQSWRDIVVPYQVDNKQTVKRYYHAFTKRSLAKIVTQSNLEIVKISYAKQGEWTPWNRGYNLVCIARKLRPNN